MTTSQLPIHELKKITKKISSKIKEGKIKNKNDLLTYKLKHSLAEHDGNEDSKMNTEQRNRSSIFTENFKDKENE